jgi:hypothetical protein
MKNEEQIASVVVLWLTFIGILFAVSIIGLVISVINGIMFMFGLQPIL